MTNSNTCSISFISKPPSLCSQTPSLRRPEYSLPPRSSPTFSQVPCSRLPHEDASLAQGAQAIYNLQYVCMYAIDFKIMPGCDLWHSTPFKCAAGYLRPAEAWLLAINSCCPSSTPPQPLPTPAAARTTGWAFSPVESLAWRPWQLLLDREGWVENC